MAEVQSNQSASSIIRPISPSLTEEYGVRSRREKYTKPNSPTSLHPRTTPRNLDSSASDSDSSISADFLSKPPESSNPDLSTVTHPIRIALLIICLVLGVLVFYFCYFASDVKADVEVQIAKLMEAFPSQSIRLWATVKAALLSHRSDSKNEKGPTVLLFAPTGNTNANFQHFLEQFSGSLKALDRRWSCVAINPHASVRSSSPEILKKQLHYELIETYGNRGRCLHVVGIDRLPGEAALVLHGFSDPNSSPLRNAFLLLSIEQPPRPHSRTTPREMETHLRSYLHSLWDASLGRDEVDALLSRLTSRIGIIDV